MKKTNSTEETLDCLSRVKGEDQRVGDSKGIQRLMQFLLLLLQEIRAYPEKLYEIQRDAEKESRQRF